MNIKDLNHNQLVDLIERLYFHPASITAKEKMALSKYLEMTLIGKDKSIERGEGI